MSFFQRLITTFVSRETAAAMEAESRRWKVICPNCQYTRSIWDLGGIRYGASGKSATRLRCPQCQQRGWHPVRKDA